MARQSSFRFTVAAVAAVESVFAQHAGAARFAYNECLREVKDRLESRRGRLVAVPWSGFDLVNHFNAWKRSEAAGRIWAVDSDGQVELIDVGLAWRDRVCAQVFEEAAIDLGRALAAYTDSKAGRRRGRRVSFPRFKRKGLSRESFRLRNRISRTGAASVRVGTAADPRVIVLPRFGPVPVREDTRRLRRLLRPGPDGVPRARIWFATVSRHRGRWIITLNVHAPDLHPGLRYPNRTPDRPAGGFVGVDRGLAAWVVAATVGGEELARLPAPKVLVRALPRLRRASKALSRKQPGSRNRAKAARRLGRVHRRVADQRRWCTHQVSTRLVKNHDRLCIEDLAVANLGRNWHLARSLADAAWGEIGRQLIYKAGWYGTTLAVAPRFFPSSKTCSGCGQVNDGLSLADRAFRCQPIGGGCGLVIDRDRNAAVNLAAWAEVHYHPDGGGMPGSRTCKQRAGSSTPVEGSALATAPAVVKLPRNPTPSAWEEAGTAPYRQAVERTPEKGAVE